MNQKKNKTVPTRIINRLKKSRITIALFFGIVSVVLLWVYLPAYMLTEHNGNLGDAGSHGDIYGAVNALFTALAFAFLIYTSLMQREELRLQRKDLKLTREELKKTADAQKELVQLTKEAHEFQIYIRRKDIQPEFSIQEAIPSGRPGDVTLKLVLAPQRVPLFLEDLKVIGDKDYSWNSKDFESRIGQLISTQTYLILRIEVKDLHNITHLKIQLVISDVDQLGHYRQEIVWKDMHWELQSVIPLKT